MPNIERKLPNQDELASRSSEELVRQARIDRHRRDLELENTHRDRQPPYGLTQAGIEKYFQAVQEYEQRLRNNPEIYAQEVERVDKIVNNDTLKNLLIELVKYYNNENTFTLLKIEAGSSGTSPQRVVEASLFLSELDMTIKFVSDCGLVYCDLYIARGSLTDPTWPFLSLRYDSPQALFTKLAELISECNEGRKPPFLNRFLCKHNS